MEKSSYQPKENLLKEKSVKKRMVSLKTKVILFETLVLIALIVFGWYFYQYFKEKIVVAEKSNKQMEILKSEKERCAQFLAKEGGNFDEYDYCRQLIQRFKEEKKL